MQKTFRGKTLRITVQNPEHRESGVTRLVLNGSEHAPGLVLTEELQADNELLVVL